MPGRKAKITRKKMNKYYTDLKSEWMGSTRDDCA